MKKGNIMYGQSGGPSPVINASLYGVIKEALANQDKIEKVYLLKHGIQGVLQEDFVDVNEIESDIELLKNTPASALGSVRFKLASHHDDPTTYEKLLQVFIKYEIRLFIYNGGNDSMDTCVKLNNFLETTDYEMSVIGIPKTVDNDLPFTDHTPGFGSAAKYIINTIMQLKLDSVVYPSGKVTIVEVMGRHAGWLTASTFVAKKEGFGPDLIYLPEKEFSIKNFLNSVESIYYKTDNCLIVVSEGIKDCDGNFISSLNDSVDAFGHKQLGGVAKFLGQVIENELGIPYRSIELNTPQRSASFIRSVTDVNEAIMVGREAVNFGIQGLTGKMVSIQRLDLEDYIVEYKPVDVNKVANKEQTIPLNWILENRMSDEFFNYIYPLIEGEYQQPFKNGVQQFFKL